MKTRILLFGLLLSAFSQNSFAQLDTIPTTVCQSFRPSGWIFFQPSAINVGDLFTSYGYCFFNDPDDAMVEDRTWSDDFLNFNHHHYQQEYKGVPVEGCEFIEHAHAAGDLVYANGKICSQINTRYVEKPISEEVAIANMLAHYSGVTEWSWENMEFEYQYKWDLLDSFATSYPQGELVYTTNDWNVPIQYDMNATDMRMAWKFEVYSIAPYFYITTYVDAVTGDVFKEISNDHHDGPANIPHYGTVTLDTRFEGFPTNAHVLHTNDAGRNVHTKYDGAFSWGLTGEVQDSDGDWGTSEQDATAAHFGVSTTWDYFQDIHGRDGLDGNGNKVRVFAATTDAGGAWYSKLGGIDRLFAGFYSDDGVYAGELTVMAHEFTHGVDERSGKLQQINEQGALDESFADIFAFLTRRYYNGSTSWSVGVPSTTVRNRRSLQNPNSLGFHYDYTYSGGVITSVSESPGQPDTYDGTWWHPWDESGNDQGGVHINNAIQNKWFYILCMGEVGTNDLGDAYSVSGIGIDKAADIAYYNLTSNMEKTSQFEDAMEGAIATAMLYYGNCSYEHIETQNAWYAVGVGTESTCVGASIDENHLDFEIYPNPVRDNLNISFDSNSERTIQIFSVNGQLLKTVSNSFGQNYSIEVTNFASGTYILNVIDGENSQRTKFVKR